MRWWRGLFGLAGAAWVLLLAVRCHLPRHAAVAGADSTSAVYVIKHGWHAGIAVRRADIPDGRWPVPDAFSRAQWLEVGWGEARYYPGDARGMWGLVRAGLWPTGSVLHVVPVRGSVPGRFRHHTIVRVPVSAEELDALTAFLTESFAVDSTGTAVPVDSGFYVDSRFYRSSLPYHVFNNCNHWAAAALRAAGCEVAPRWVFAVGQVVRRARECGALVQRGATD